jgi:hypothetical protein
MPQSGPMRAGLATHQLFCPRSVRHDNLRDSATTSKTSLNRSIVDGSQDCLFAPISTTTDPPTGRLLEVR